jgi:hypothetical protein
MVLDMGITIHIIETIITTIIITTIIIITTEILVTPITQEEQVVQTTNQQIQPELPNHKILPQTVTMVIAEALGTMVEILIEVVQVEAVVREVLLAEAQAAVDPQVETATEGLLEVQAAQEGDKSNLNHVEIRY